MDLNLIKSKLGSLQQQRGSGGSKKDLSQVIWKPTVGKHSVRIVPSAYNKSNPFKEMFFHYGIGATRTMVSLVNFGEKDPIVEFAEQLRKSSDKDSWNMAKKLAPKLRVFVPVVVRGEEDKGVRLWEFGKQIYMELLAIAEDEDVGDYTDPMQGRDITIETTDAASNGTGYNQSKVRVRTKITPLSADSKEVQLWLTTQPDVMSLFKKYGYEEMKTSLLEWLNPGEETPAAGETETPTAPAVEAKPLTPAPGYSLNAKPKVDVDKAFDDLFSSDLPF
jgi:gp32 DNA binding protein like